MTLRRLVGGLPARHYHITAERSAQNKIRAAQQSDSGINPEDSQFGAVQGNLPTVGIAALYSVTPCKCLDGRLEMVALPGTVNKSWVSSIRAPGHAVSVPFVDLKCILPEVPPTFTPRHQSEFGSPNMLARALHKGWNPGF